MDRIEQYLQAIESICNRLKTEGRKTLEAAACAIADCLEQGGMIYCFGTGHSHMMAEEWFYRAGGMVRVYPIFDEDLMLHRSASGSTEAERREGYASALLQSYPCNAGDLMLIASNSGRNAVTVEMALEAKRRGMTIMVLTNMTHSSRAVSRHSSGKKLFEIADIVLDNYGVYGDACVALGDELMVSPTSTAVGAIILNALEAQAMELLLQRGVTPEVFLSSNVEGGDESNEYYISKYRQKIKCM